MRMLFLVLILIGFHISARAAVPGKMESSLLCHKNSQQCAVWWNYKTSKSQAFWRERRLRDRKLNSVTLTQKAFEQDLAFVKAMVPKRKPTAVCRNPFLYIEKVASSQTICADSLSKGDMDHLNLLFR